MKTLMAVLVLTAASQALAQLPDPTRPPGMATDGGATLAATAETGVQAVFLRQGARPAALINGEYVVQGGRLGDRRVVKITETEVVLRDAAGNKETMRVITGAEKTPVVHKAAVRKKKPSGAMKGAPDEGAREK